MVDDSFITHAIKSYYSQTFTGNGLDPKNMWTSLSYFLKSPWNKRYLPAKLTNCE